MLTTAEAPEVQRLLADERVSVIGFARADAYVALLPFLRKVTLPMGVGDLAANRPPHDVTLVAAAESLLVREKLHPAMQFLLLQAADEIHSGAGIFQKPGQFPAPERVDVPLSDEARPFYKSGGTFFQRHLPFWLWVFATRALLILIPLAGLVYPLAQLIPAAVAFEVHHRLSRLYGELRGIETRIGAPGFAAADIVRDLERFEEKIRRTRVPQWHAQALYTLKQHAGLVRDRFLRSGAGPGGPDHSG
jgi:hypothetical protein